MNQAQFINDVTLHLVDQHYSRDEEEYDKMIEEFCFKCPDNLDLLNESDTDIGSRNSMIKEDESLLCAKIQISSFLKSHWDCSVRQFKEDQVTKINAMMKYDNSFTLERQLQMVEVPNSRWSRPNISKSSPLLSRFISIEGAQ